jgi:3-methyladenine DNA glycosylase AlkD
MKNIQDKNEIAKLIYERLKCNDLQGLTALLSNKLTKEKTERLEITKTPFLNSIGQQLGKLLLQEDWKFDRLKSLWKLSLSKQDRLPQGLISGREIRLIVIGALSEISKRHYERTKDFLLEILEDIQDWETCDQLALRVVVNLAIQNQKEVFQLLERWIKSDDKWIRRLAVATTPPYIRAKSAESAICLRILNQAMDEEDRDVKKALGWALREISKKDEEAVFGFLKDWIATKNKNTIQILKDGMKKLSEDKQSILNSLML